MKSTFKKSPKSHPLHHFSLFTFRFSLPSLFTFHFSLVLFFTFSFPLFTPAQQTNLDSLYVIWKDETQPDSNRVTAYKDYIWNGYLFSNPDSAEVLAEALHSYAQTHHYLKAAATGYNLQGIANWIKGNYSPALEYLEKAMEINEELGDKKGIANNLNNIGAMYYGQGNYLRALKYHEKSLAIREEIGDKKGIANSLNKIGLIYWKQGNYPLALEYYQKSLAINEEIRDKKGIADNLINIGLIYWKQGNYPRALEYYENSLAIKEEIGDKSGIAASLNNIGLIYKNQGNYSSALEYYEKSLVIIEELGNKQVIATILNNIGLIYKNQGNYSSALEYHEKSLAIEEEFGNKQGIALSLNNIGQIYRDQGNYPRALEYYEKSLAMNVEIGDKHGIVLNLNNIGFTYKKQSNYPLALDYCQKGLVLAEEIGALVQQNYALNCLYNAYKALDKGNEALVYLEKMNVIKDSLQAEETGKKLQQMEFAKVMLQDSIAKAEEARLVQEAHREEVRKQSRTRNVAIAGGIFFLLLAGGLFSRWRYIRKSRDIISKEKDRSDNLLLNILPAEIAEELKQKGRAAARDFEMVSILFTDFKSFTETSANLSAAELVHEINACFEAFDGIIEKYGIEKIKTIGDSYMAAGGLPIPKNDSVKNTVLVALEMQDFIQKRKNENEATGKPAFEMRVGIHTGPVVAGIVGVKKFQYDVWGDTVNTASRMENHGDVGKVNISQGTYELIKEDPQFRFESRGKIEAKGKGEVEMYFVSVKRKVKSEK